MARIEQLHVVLDTPYRATLAQPFRVSWFDHFMHAVSASDSEVNWDYEHVNQLESQHHFCVAVNNRGNAHQLAVFMDEMVQHMPQDMLRHTLVLCYAQDFPYPHEDRSLPYDMNPVTRIGWTLVLPNVTTNALHNVMHQLPMNRSMYASC
jgi:hypothetical protein